MPDNRAYRGQIPKRAAENGVYVAAALWMIGGVLRILYISY